MQISIIQFVLGLLLLILPTLIVYAFDPQRLRTMGLVVLRTLICSSLIVLSVWLLQRADSAWLNALVVLLLILIAALATMRRARLSSRAVYLPLLAGLAASTLVIGSYAYFLVLGQRTMTSPSVLLPFVALLLGGSVGMVADGVHAYHMGLRHHNELYLYLMGNGATHGEALRHMLRRAFRAALQSLLRQFSGTYPLALPAMTIALLMVGTDLLTAVAVQLLWLAAAMAHALVALLVALIVARRYGFDPYLRLKQKKEKTGAE